MDQVCGGFSAPRPANEEIQKICDEVKLQVHERTGMNYKDFTALLYQSQVVAGINYAIMVYVGGNDCLDVTVYQDLSGRKTVTDVKKGPAPLRPLMFPAEASS